MKFYIVLMCVILIWTIPTLAKVKKTEFAEHENYRTYNGSRFVDKWLENVPLDHFNLFDKRTWKMRYLVNDKFYEDNGPLFIEVGGEWTISGRDLIEGILPKLAKKHKGMLVETEHRYYGMSLPFGGNFSTENLAYLQTEQALEDLAFFIEKFKEKNPRLKNSKVIVHGCSYPGMLVTWLRLRFPHIVDIAYASSAPLGVGLDYSAYYEVVSDVYANVSKDCINTIKRGFNMTKELLKTEKGKQTVKEVFKNWDCGDMHKLDAEDIIWKLLGIINVQSDPYEFESVACLVMSMSMEDKGPLERFAQFIEFKTSNYNVCEEEEPEEEKDDKTEEKSEEEEIVPGSFDSIAWSYQVCTEQGTFQTLNITNSKHPFAVEATVAEAVKECSDEFDGLVTEEVLKTGIERVIRRYGGQKPKVTKVLTIQGTNDPWKHLADLEDYNPEAPVWVIKGSHCIDTAFWETDEELLEKRKKIEDQLSAWIEEIS